MNAGRTIGLFLFFIGIFFSVIGYSTYAGGATLRILLYGPVFILVGIAMMIYPGSNYSNKQLRTKEIDAKDLITKAPLKAKIIWGIAGVIGLIITEAYKENIANLF